MSAHYLLPNPEGACDSNIVPINEKYVTVQKLFFLFVPSYQILQTADK